MMAKPVDNVVGLSANICAPEAEQGLLGALLIGANINEVRKALDDSDFHIAHNRAVYKCCLSLADKRETIDLVTMCDEMRTLGLEDVIGGIAYISDLQKNTPGIASVMSYAKIIKDKSITRTMLSVVGKIKDADTTSDAMAIMREQVDKLQSMQDSLNSKGFTLLSGSEGFDHKVDWLIKNFLPSDSLGMVYGAGGSYKSFAVLDWCASIASGVEWCGNKVNAGSIIYVAGEGQSGIGKRVKAWEVVNQVRADCLYRTKSALDITADSSRRELIANCKALAAKGEPVRLIVFDTVNRCFGDGDENSTQDMTAFVQGCDAIRAETGAAILCVHHTGKDATKGARGSSVLRNACDYEYSISRAAVAGFVMKCTKAKEFEEPKPIEIPLATVEVGTFDDEGRSETSLARRGNGREPTSEVYSDDLANLISFLESSGCTMDSGLSWPYVKDEIISWHPDKTDAAKKKTAERLIKKAMEQDVVRKTSQGMVYLLAGQSTGGGFQGEF